MRGPVDWAVDRGIGMVDRRGRPTEIQLLYVGAGRPGQSTDRSTNRRILLSFLDSDSFSVLGPNPIRVSEILGILGYKYGLEPSCIVSLKVSLWYLLVMIIESIKYLACHEDVGKLRTLLNIVLACFLYYFSVPVIWVHLQLHLSLIGGFLISCCPTRVRVYN